MKKMNNTGLVIIDVQVAMFSVPNLPLYNGDKLTENISYLLDRARSSKTPVIFVQHHIGQIVYMRKEQGLWETWED
ncbi:MAG: isochorismatase family protein [Desulfosporosinus sp.]|nr:isochorismatase family protein [Desulfosporosinus sp.]